MTPKDFIVEFASTGRSSPVCIFGETAMRFQENLTLDRLFFSVNWSESFAHEYTKASGFLASTNPLFASESRKDISSILPLFMYSLLQRIEDINIRLCNIEEHRSLAESRSFPEAADKAIEAAVIEDEDSVVIPRKAAKDMILRLFEEKGELDYLEIVSSLGLDLELVVEICAELEEEGRIEGTGQ